MVGGEDGGGLEAVLRKGKPSWLKMSGRNAGLWCTRRSLYVHRFVVQKL